MDKILLSNIKDLLKCTIHNKMILKNRINFFTDIYYDKMQYITLGKRDVRDRSFETMHDFMSLNEGVKFIV
ncbi:hypothetical protein KH172YL63_31680 [Bacillus sp. KH172YL63]|nr:hypothetical protein KH172YL63_31680 [Bacillus sp. KH172YL63]